MDSYSGFRGNSTFVLMKYVLILYLESFVNEPPVITQQHIVPTEFNSYYQCISDGYIRSYNTLMNIGEDLVDEQLLAVKFECKKIKVTKS